MDTHTLAFMKVKQLHKTIFREKHVDFPETLSLFTKYVETDKVRDGYTYFNIIDMTKLIPDEPSEIYYIKSKDFSILLNKLEVNTDKKMQSGYVYYTFCLKHVCKKCNKAGHTAKACPDDSKYQEDEEAFELESDTDKSTVFSFSNQIVKTPEPPSTIKTKSVKRKIIDSDSECSTTFSFTPVKSQQNSVEKMRTPFNSRKKKPKKK